MNDFLKNILSSAIGVILAIFMFMGSILILVMISSAINLIFSGKDKIDANSIVKIKMDYTITDKPNTDPFANFSPFGGFEPNNSIHLNKILTSHALDRETKSIMNPYI